jgi:hypothetical protein
MKLSRIVKPRGEEKSVPLGRIGKIKIGEKRMSGNGKMYPVSTDYFIADCDEEYKQYFHKSFGDKPQKIRGVFFSNDFSDSCPNYYELRDKTGATVVRGNGEDFEVATAGEDGKVFMKQWTKADIARTAAKTADEFMRVFEQRTGCKFTEILKLRFMLLSDMPIVGFWELSTKAGLSTIPQILSQIEAVNEMAGRISGIPFDLIVKKVKSDKAGDKSVFPVVSIVFNISPENLERLSQFKNIKGLLTNEKINALAIAPPDTEMPPIVSISAESTEESEADSSEIQSF